MSSEDRSENTIEHEEDDEDEEEEEENDQREVRRLTDENNTNDPPNDLAIMDHVLNLLGNVEETLTGFTNTDQRVTVWQIEMGQYIVNSLREIIAALTNRLAQEFEPVYTHREYVRNVTMLLFTQNRIIFASDEDGVPLDGTRSIPVVRDLRLLSSTTVRCAICLNRLRDEDEKRQLPCLHIYHKVCIDQWLQERPSCPLCRRGPADWWRLGNGSQPSGCTD